MDRRERLQPPKPWIRKLISVGVTLAIFVLINSTINQAPYSRDDVTPGKMILFFVPLFTCLYFSFGLLSRWHRRRILAAFLICALLLFRVYDLTSPINVSLLFALVGLLEWYFSRQKISISHPNTTQ